MAEGGGRWYHLYPDEKIPHDDILHWTRQHFNWNYMCADCHSTKLEKNYDRATDSYHTTWAEIDVACEACHGPGSEHVKWAASPDDYRGEFADVLGLAVVLKERELAAWIQDPDTGKPRRSRPLESDVQVEACARCHGRRHPITDDYAHGQRLGDTHRPALLDEALYHHDGQIKEEVYVHGSFVQSKMFHKGVRCTDCHNPHTLKLRATGNALCAQCHQPAQYDTPAHHFHAPGSTGAQCVDCHMPEQHYMVVDPRRDHSIRIPRPDLSEKLGSPNACTQCHTDQTNKWAADALAKWLKGAGRTLPDTHYGEIFAAGRSGERWAEPRLIDLVGDMETPPIVRATALSVLGERMTANAFDATTAALGDADPMVRESALGGLERLEPARRIAFGAALLEDPVRMVRIRAARVLAPAHVALAAGPHAVAFAAALEEFKASLLALADRPGAYLGLGLLYGALGDAAAEEEAYRQAFVVDPQHIESRLNLAEILYRQGRIDEAGELLAEAVVQQPDRGVVHEAMGRHLVRVKQYERALLSLAEAVRLMPDNAHIHYFYGVALNQLGQFQKALPVLQRAHEIDPENVDYLGGLATICRDAREWDLALGYVQKLLDMYPGAREYLNLQRGIRASMQLGNRKR